MADGDEVRIDGSLNDDISAVVNRIEQRVASLEHEFDKLGRTGAKSGAEFAEGVDKAGRAADKAGRDARRATPPVKELGDEAEKTGAKATLGATGLDRFSRSAKKAGRNAGGVGTILTGLKFAGIVTGVFALAGGLSALGAGGVIAVGGLAPMVGVFAGVLPVMAAARLSMLAYKLAASSLEPVLTRLRNQFTELGPVIAKGGLEQGLDSFTNSAGKLATVTGHGLAGLGGELGDTATQAGRLVSSAPFLRQVSTIFAGLRPIVRNLSGGLLSLAQVLLNVLQAALPMAQEASADFRDAALWLQRWTAAQLANGRMAAWLNKAWQIFTRAVGVLVDFLVGLWHIFRIGAGYAGQMGSSIEDAARHFRSWTSSAAGQARINKYFQDSLPALREMGKLLGMAVAGFAHLGANQNVAPLLEQIRTQFAPALGDLVNHLSGQGGLGPALIEAATAMVRLFASMNFSGLTLFVLAIARVAEALVWLTQHVPGASLVMSTLLGTMLGFKLLGPVFTLVGKGGQAFRWTQVAAKGTSELTMAQRAMGPVLRGLGTVFSTVGNAIIKVIVGIGDAFLANPILLVIAVIIGLIVLLWFKCAWFRNAVIAVWHAISAAAIATWNALKTAFFAVVNALSVAAVGVRNFFVGIWKAISTALVSAFTAAKNVVVGIVNVIIDVVMAIWNHGVKQVLGVIVGAFTVAFYIIRFIVQTAIYIMVAIFIGLAYAVRWVTQMIAAGWNWLWANVIAPVINAIRNGWNALTSAVSAGWNWLVGILTSAWNTFWSVAIAPVINAIHIGWTALTSAISSAWTWVVGVLSTAWNGFWSAVVAPVINTVRGAWQGLTSFATWAWDSFVQRISAIWHGFTGVVSGVIGTIRSAWSGLTSWLSSVFAPVGAGISNVWNGIKNTATTVAGVVKGAWNTVVSIAKGVWNTIANVWNGIPDIHVPDWVPFIGGKTFGLPKLPTLYTGGATPGGPALVGEHGPEPLVRGGRIVDMLGARGPEVRNLPRGGYVLPNLATLTHGLAKPIPASVATSVAAQAPGYAAAGAAYDSGLRSAVRELAEAVRGQRPPIHASGPDVEQQVLSALRTYDRERRAAGERRGPYDYEAGRG